MMACTMMMMMVTMVPSANINIPINSTIASASSPARTQQSLLLPRRDLLIAGLSALSSSLSPISSAASFSPVSSSSSSSSSPSSSSLALENNFREGLEEEELEVVSLFEESTRSVVCIKVVEVTNPRSLNQSVDDRTEEGAKLEGTGSGFVWDRYGHIVTNFHVVEKLVKDPSGKQQVQVSLLCPDGNVITRIASLIGIDSTHDLAVIKVDAPVDVLKPLPVGSSKSLRVGQSCFAIGNPYGYTHTLTTGVISGLGREIPSPAGRPIVGAIQTDAAINAGNSGGPLLDSFGHIIGINTATFTRQGSGMSSGVNFAIPIDPVVRIVPYLIVNGTLSSFVD